MLKKEQKQALEDILKTVRKGMGSDLSKVSNMSIVLGEPEEEMEEDDKYDEDDMGSRLRRHMKSCPYAE